MDLTVGPCQFLWPASTWRDFYARLADEAPVERVVLGELVCAKRLPLYEAEIPAAVERLTRAGKEVLLTSLALVTLERERALMAALAASGATVEVSDLTLLAYLPPGTPFAVGPLVNLYNESTLAWLAGRGARRVCLPPELPLASVETLARAGARLGVAVEVWGFGRLPLAIAGRCYHARLHGRSKDSCRHVCGEDPDGLEVATLDGRPFLAVNGVQTLSDGYAMHAGLAGELRAAGVAALRLSPHSGDLVAIARLFRAGLDGALGPPELAARLEALLPGRRLANGFLVGAAGAEWRAGRAEPAQRPAAS